MDIDAQLRDYSRTKRGRKLIINNFKKTQKRPSSIDIFELN